MRAGDRQAELAPLNRRPAPRPSAAATRVMSQRRDDDRCPESLVYPRTDWSAKRCRRRWLLGCLGVACIERPVQRGGRPNYAASPQRGAHRFANLRAALGDVYAGVTNVQTLELVARRLFGGGGSSQDVCGVVGAEVAGLG